MDTELFHIMNRGMANPLFDVLMPALTFQGYLLVIPLVAYTLYAGSRAKSPEGRSCFSTAFTAVLIALFAAPVADALVNQLKMLIAQPRPCHALEGIRLLVPCPSSLSMPSSHAATSFAFATPLFALTRPFLPLPWRITPLAIAAMVAFTRPYVGVHYPSDIFVGALLGSGVAVLPCLFLRRAGVPPDGRRKTS